MPVQFGTDGWRAVISDTFTFSNLRSLTQAIADAFSSDSWPAEYKGKFCDRKRVVVGYDTRFLSDRYAAEAARVLAANGFTVHLAAADAPTPAISYAVSNLNAIGGIMITASHNARATMGSSSNHITADPRCPSTAMRLKFTSTTMRKKPAART